MDDFRVGMNISGSAIAVSIILAFIKITTGIIGNSYALIADGIESTTDIFSSLIVWGSLKISSKPPDEDHPYGHGKVESMAGLIVALSLLSAAIIIAVQSVNEILTPHHTPAWYTLIVLILVIITKEILFRRMVQVGKNLESRSLQNDAWHHRSDAITSFAAFLGISIALIGGQGYESADDWAALIACVVILYSGINLLKPAVDELMDRAAPVRIENEIRTIASSVEGAKEIEKCRIRKSGLDYLVDIHVIVSRDITVQKGHKIGHQVKDRLLNSHINILDVTVHIEPDIDYSN